MNQSLNLFGFKPKCLAAVDMDAAALSLLKANFNPLVTKAQSVEDLVRYSVDLSGSIEDFVTKQTIVDSQISQFKENRSIGWRATLPRHSNLNNKTRRHDPRNLLYFIMPAFAAAPEIPCVVIENVQSMTASENVEFNKDLLRSHGYSVRKSVSSRFWRAQLERVTFLLHQGADAGARGVMQGFKCSTYLLTILLALLKKALIVFRCGTGT